MKVFDYTTKTAQEQLRRIMNRGTDYSRKDYRQVEQIIGEVRRNGDRALEKYTRQFDAPGLKAARLRVTPQEFKAAGRQVDRQFRHSLARAIRQIETFHQAQRENSWISTDRPGVVVGQQITPVDSAGIYVPGARGGETPLVSTVLMGVLPARQAGVPRIVMVTPPRKDGSVSPHLLVAAEKTGVTEVYKVGSAWAIAALAYGTETIPRVDMIAGPGNKYVVLAKKTLSGTVGIDIIAGPSEILIIADQTADPRYLAADLLSQAEHDALASAVLITPVREIARQTAREVDAQLSALNRQETAKKALARYGGIFIVDSMETALTTANRFAPEHLELQVEEPFAMLGRIRNAGAVFLGRFTPEPIGDYVAGPNHTLPTGGCARFASALSTSHFLKRTSVVFYSEAALKAEAPDAIRLAEIEGLGAHANAIRVRLEK
ncbi:MAG: histidinol dehydrogenase [Thermodesulfobacteriota bacterium]